MFNVPSSDSIFYLRKFNFQISGPFSFCCDTTIQYIKTTIDLDDNLNIIWGEGRKEFPPEIEEIFHSKIVNLKWNHPLLVASYKNKSDTPRKLNVFSLPDSSLLAYWNINSLPEMRFTYFDGNGWSTPFKPFPKYSWEPKLGYSGYCFYPNHFLGKDGKIYFSFRGIKDGDLPPVGFKSQILYIENEFNNRDWQLLEPSKIDVSTTEFYHYPKIACTTDQIRYLVWEVDKNLDNFPDNIYYMFSLDGKLWEGPYDITNYSNAYLSEHIIAPDQKGNIFVIWKYSPLNSYGTRDIKYYYAIINKENYSDYSEIPYISFQNGARSVNLNIDKLNTLHLIWLEDKYKTHIGIVIKHIWKRISTSVSLGGSIQAKKNCNKKIMAKTYPNPFNRTTYLEINLSEPAMITVVIFNINGQIIQTLLKDNYIDSTIQVLWNGTDSNGKVVSSGVYYFLITAKRDMNQEDGELVKFIMLK